jgi:small neutral amino acid transporter SnatA (MarC family)
VDRREIHRKSRAEDGRRSERIREATPKAAEFALLAVSFLFGSIILDFFGISLFVVEIAGGLVVAATGWSLRMMTRPDLRHRERWRMLLSTHFFR